MMYIFSLIIATAISISLYSYSIGSIPFFNFLIGGFIIGLFWKKYFVDFINSLFTIIISNAFSILGSGIGYKVKLGSFNL
ncbi:MAG: hypothetical protein NZ870_00685 [bacterium]|nr:hypothetical protein [bacterium]